MVEAQELQLERLVGLDERKTAGIQYGLQCQSGSW